MAALGPAAAAPLCAAPRRSGRHAQRVAPRSAGGGGARPGASLLMLAARTRCAAAERRDAGGGGVGGGARPSASPLQDALLRGAHPAAALGGAAAACAAAAAAALAPPRAPLAGVDAAAHALVVASTDAAWRAGVAEDLISNAPIALGLAGWAAASGVALAAAPRRAAAPLAAAWGLYAAAAGAVGRYDPPLVAALKQAFARPRPSQELHHTFSFPSGHSTAAAFIAGALLLVLLPLARRAAAGRRSGGAAAAGMCRLPDAVVLPAWAAAWGTTAAGRVLADAVRRAACRAPRSSRARSTVHARPATGP